MSTQEPFSIEFGDCLIEEMEGNPGWLICKERKVKVLTDAIRAGLKRNLGEKTLVGFRTDNGEDCFMHRDENRIHIGCFRSARRRAN